MTYQELVSQRKNDELGAGGLINPSVVSNGKFDTGEFLDPWAKWHNSVPAEILLVGQDWGSQEYYLKNSGMDTGSNPTCKNLIELFNSIGIDIGTPENPAKSAGIHFANVIPFLRTGAMQGNLEKILSQRAVNKVAEVYIRPLIDLVKPGIIITLGKTALISVASLYDINIGAQSSLKGFTEAKPLNLKEGLMLFPMFHCGSSGVNRNRNLNVQKADWSKIVPYL